MKKLLIASVLVLLVSLTWQSRFPAYEHKGTFKIIGDTADHEFLIGIPEKPNAFTFIFEKKYQVGDVVTVYWNGSDEIVKEILN